jgi:hypothetical protein
MQYTEWDGRYPYNIPVPRYLTLSRGKISGGASCRAGAYINKSHRSRIAIVVNLAQRRLGSHDELKIDPGCCSDVARRVFNRFVWTCTTFVMSDTLYGMKWNWIKFMRSGYVFLFDIWKRKWLNTRHGQRKNVMLSDSFCLWICIHDKWSRLDDVTVEFI